MADLRDLVKEEVVKNIIDKLIFGLVAALIVFGVQKCSDTNKREQIEKEAILRLDSGFVLNEAMILQNAFSDYIALVTESISLGLPLTPKKQQNLLMLRVKIESSIEVLSVYRKRILTESESFTSTLKLLSDRLRSFDSERTEEYQAKLNSLKEIYGSLLGIIKISAIDSLPK